MTYKPTGRPTGKPRIIYSLEQVELFASRQLSIREIAHKIGIKPTLLEKHWETRKEVRNAIERGRAESTLVCADVVVRAARPLSKRELEKLKAEGKEPLEITSQNLKAALEYLNRFGENWKPQPQAHTVVQQHSGTVQVNTAAADALPEDVKARAAWAFLKTRGQLPADCPMPQSHNVRPLKKVSG